MAECCNFREHNQRRRFDTATGGDLNSFRHGISWKTQNANNGFIDESASSSGVEGEAHKRAIQGPPNASTDDNQPFPRVKARCHKMITMSFGIFPVKRNA